MIPSGCLCVLWLCVAASVLRYQLILSSKWITVNSLVIQMSDFCDRLREERDRLGLTQAAFGAIGGVQKQAQFKYEKGERFPDAGYLSEIVKVGADVQYLITGQRSTQALTSDEEQLITLFRAAPLSVKAATMAGLAAGGAPLTGSVTNTNSGDGAQQNFVHSTVGSVTTGDVILGRGKKKT